MTASDTPVCEICEKAPADPGDCMCVPCRIETVARSEVVHDPVLIVLNRHQHICGLSDLDATTCMCGERFEGGPGYYRVHVATLIYEALGLEGPVPNTPAADEPIYGESE